MHAYNSLKVKNSKWCVSYSVFDGEELLEESIKSIRSQVDWVQVCYQTVSWTGKAKNEKLPELLFHLKDKGLIDELIEFKPDFEKKPWHNELKKRNIGLQYAKKAKCDYFMTMDTDEFYFEKELEWAKHIIVQKRLTHSYCAQEMYQYKPTEKIIDTRGCYVPFFAKVYPWSRLGDNKKAPCLCDPTRMILNFPFSKSYVLEKIIMQHMKRVRKNLKEKYLNSSGWHKKLKVKESQTVTVPDYFNISHIFE